MRLWKFLIIFVVFSILSSCCTTPETVYIEPDPPVLGDGIPRPVLDNFESISVNEYKLMIVVIRWELQWITMQETLKIITPEKYLEEVNKRLDQIKKIQEEIDRLELLD